MADPLDPLAGLSVPRADQKVVGAIPEGDYSYGNLDRTVRGLSSTPGLTETILPSIKALLMPGANNPYTNLIDASTGANVAQAQTDAMKRGLTGSDIEAAAMTGARGQGEMAKSQFYAQNAQSMAGFLKDMVSGDIGMQRENLMALAELMGQKIQSEQDLKMFREMLDANLGQADKNRKSALWGAGISAAGSVAGAAVKYSDERLKVGLRRVGHVAGVDIFKFRWSKIAQAFGAHDDEEVGVLAGEVSEVYPEAVGEKDGWKTVDYTKMPEIVFDTVNLLGA